MVGVGVGGDSKGCTLQKRLPTIHCLHKKHYYIDEVAFSNFELYISCYVMFDLFKIATWHQITVNAGVFLTRQPLQPNNHHIISEHHIKMKFISYNKYNKLIIS